MSPLEDLMRRKAMAMQVLASTSGMSKVYGVMWVRVYSAGALAES